MAVGSFFLYQGAKQTKDKGPVATIPGAALQAASVGLVTRGWTTFFYRDPRQHIDVSEEVYVNVMIRIYGEYLDVYDMKTEDYARREYARVRDTGVLAISLASGNLGKVSLSEGAVFKQMATAIGKDLAAAKAALVNTPKFFKNLPASSRAAYVRLLEAVRKLRFKTWGVDPTMRVADKARGVIVNGRYLVNPTAKNLAGLLTDSGKVGGKRMSGRFMYVVNTAGDIIVGTRAGRHMPHPTLIGGANPQVRAAGIVDIRGGRIYSVNNASGHFKPGAGSLSAAKEAFRRLLPDSAFHKNFQGFLPWNK